ncbi:hypothetical protein [Sphingobacterium corticibacter]|uniref:Uncharacterized protein n=1 Tax=Sphingobacterium corticibacter TaxID=2171749 RepID=A0A2T8HM24_9SPHI|nr:hypothetical protein [Sphingobacterium corticibacter]PVH26491.1 hypothetical protein DC487_02415 [Sphingobacterium corticibacter]
MISLSSLIWYIDYIPKKIAYLSYSSVNFLADYEQQDTSGLQVSNLPFPVRQDTDTIVLDEIQINRPLFNADSLQVHEYFKTLSQKSSPSWKSIFIDRTTSNEPLLPNRASSTSSLISLDLLSIIGRLTTKKKSSEQTDDMWNNKERYIEQHFDSTLVKRMTGLSGIALEEFVHEKRPLASDLSDTVMYELMKYIKSKHNEE